MSNDLDNLQKLGDLLGACRQPETIVIENLRTLSIEGPSLSQQTYALLSEISSLCDTLGSPAGIRVDDEPWGEFDFDEASGAAWNLQIGKVPLAKACPQSGHEVTNIYFFADQFLKWSLGFDPFTRTELDSSKSTRIFVRTLQAGFGSAKLSVLPWFDSAPDDLNGAQDLPTYDTVHEIIHAIGANTIYVVPDYYGLTWGLIDGPSAAGFLRHSVHTLAACLAQEVRSEKGGYRLVLRGLRKVEPELYAPSEPLDSQLNGLLVKIISWIFEERRETRHKLLVDRLTLDYETGQSYIQCLKNSVQKAWEQAKDSYGFVILERKDAYQKELREFMKDARTQADLFASKVRDLVSGLSRDLMAVLLVIGASILAKLDVSQITSSTVSIFFKVLAGYLMFSCIIQLGAHFRDASLAFAESTSWLKILRNYSSTAELEARFTEPIKKRRTTFRIAAALTFLCYLGVAGCLWYAAPIAKTAFPEKFNQPKNMSRLLSAMNSDGKSPAA